MESMLRAINISDDYSLSPYFRSEYNVRTFKLKYVLANKTICNDMSNGVRYTLIFQDDDFTKVLHEFDKINKKATKKKPTGLTILKRTNEDYYPLTKWHINCQRNKLGK